LQEAAVSIHVALHHVTHYRYDRAVELGPQIVRLRPAAHSRTRILSYALKVLPEQHFINWQQDPQGNYLARLVFPEKTDELRIEVDLVAEMAVFNPFDFFLEPDAEKFPFCYAADEQRELAPYLETLPLTPRFADYLAGIDRTPLQRRRLPGRHQPTPAADIGYLIRMEPGVQTPEETLDAGLRLVPRFGWLLVQLLRHLRPGGALRVGLPDPAHAPTSKPSTAPAAPRWTSPTCTPGARCTCPAPAGSAWTPPPACWPVKATFRWPAPRSIVKRRADRRRLVDECEVEFTHDMQVTRIWESPRVTLPYTDEQWGDRQALGGRSMANCWRTTCA
jgi:hypothetical protein